MPGMVENQYRLDVSHRQQRSEQLLAELNHLLSTILTVFDGGACAGGTSEEVRRELEELRLGVLGMVDQVRNQYGFVLSTQPMLIEDGTWQARWMGR